MRNLVQMKKGVLVALAAFAIMAAVVDAVATCATYSSWRNSDALSAACYCGSNSNSADDETANCGNDANGKYCDHYTFYDGSWDSAYQCLAAEPVSSCSNFVWDYSSYTADPSSYENDDECYCGSSVTDGSDSVANCGGSNANGKYCDYQGSSSKCVVTVTEYTSSYDTSYTCHDDAHDFWIKAIITCNLLGVFLMAVPSIVLGSLPACCGKAVEQRKILGGLGIPLGIFSWFMPLIGAATGATGACKKMCAKAECKDDYWCLDYDYDNDEYTENDDDCRAAYGIWGAVVAYTQALGFLPLILGIVGLSLSCAACCGCCKAKPAMGGAAGVVAQGAVVQGAVVQGTVMQGTVAAQPAGAVVQGA